MLKEEWMLPLFCDDDEDCFDDGSDDGRDEDEDVGLKRDRERADDGKERRQINYYEQGAHRGS
jgi:hypothetical protein